MEGLINQKTGFVKPQHQTGLMGPQNFDTAYRFPVVREDEHSNQPLVEEITYTPEPTPLLFHNSDAFVRGIMGPIGSGKSVACCAEIFLKANQQKPFRNKRRSRWAIVRNTFPELKTTTIKTWMDWFEDYTEMKYGSPIEGLLEYAHHSGDGTIVHLELIFIALDLPKDVKKLKSLELTGVFFNEASEIRKTIVDMGTGRVGRYPGLQQGGPSWSGVIMDTNAPDDLHWWYEIAEEGDIGESSTEIVGGDNDRWDFFRQPPAIVLLEDGRYAFNPKCENINNQPLGAAYWIRQVKNKTPEWIKVFLTGDYGSIVDGKPVYVAQWSDQLHMSAVNLLPIKYKEIIMGFDFGLWPSCIIAQVSLRGQLKVLEELVGEDMGVKQFIVDVVKPTLSAKYKHNPYIAIGDPAGNNRTENEAVSVIQTVAEVGMTIMPAPDLSNAIAKRLEAVRHFLTRLVDGKPTFQMSPSCKILRKGFNGGYRYQKLQVSGDEDRYQPKPLKNEYSHPHDGLQYLCSYLTQDLNIQPGAGHASIPEGDGPADATAGY